MLSAQMGELPQFNLSNIELSKLDFSNIGTISQQVNAQLQAAGIPQVDLVAAFTSGGMPAVQNALATAATKTSLFQDLMTTAQSNIKKLAETSAGKFVIQYKWPILGGVAVLIYMAFFRGSRRAGVAANPRRHRKHRKHRR